MNNIRWISRKQFLGTAVLALAGIFMAGTVSCGTNEGGTMANRSDVKCADCPMRARYDRDPKALLSRIWKWHTKWCPGWKAYLASLPEGERARVREQYQ